MSTTMDIANFFKTKLNVEELLDDLNRLLSKWSDTSSSELVFELQSLRTYFYCWLQWNDDRSFDKVIKNFEPNHLFVIIRATVKRAADNGDDDDFEKLRAIIHQLKPKIKADCLNFVDCDYSKSDLDMDKLSTFVRGISFTLGGLLVKKCDAISDLKLLIESLKRNLDFFAEFLDFEEESCRFSEEFEDFKDQFLVLACRAAHLSILNWIIDVKKENMVPRMVVLLSNLVEETSLSTPKVQMMYLSTMMQFYKPLAHMSFTVGKLVHKFVGSLLDNLQVDPENDGIQMLFLDLIFFITFLMDWRAVEKLPGAESVLIQVNYLVSWVLPLNCSLNSGEIKEGVEKMNFLLHHFLEKTNAIKAEVRKICAPLFPSSPSFNFSGINVLRRIDSLLENLKGFSRCFPKLPIVMLQEELTSLKDSSLEDFFIPRLQNKHKEIKYLWTRIVNVSYNAERAANSFTHMKFLWHDFLHFYDVIEECKLIKGEMKRIRDQFIMYDIHDDTNSNKSPEALPPLLAIVPITDEVVGFKNEIKTILDRITGGSEELDIVSIVGMPGSGKTTLAKKVYASVKHQFHRHAWCTISQTFNKKILFLDILRGIGVCVDDLYDEEDEDLAHILCKSLKGRRYLIVMDDIWDLSAWNMLKLSFPNDKLGSRIMFTSRIHDLVLTAIPNCAPVPLKALSEKESWELLEKKLFDQGRCPTDFVNIGKRIAAKCKGLPLCVVLVAGVLKENIEDLNWWRQVGERLGRLIAKEKCMDILELSYKHLPEYLKPCFLYFGSFSEDEEIQVKFLILLWISEGFIQKHVSKTEEVVANEYFMDLVGRSLVIPIKRSSTGRIKTCSVHDLLREFCFAKGEEENIFKVLYGNVISHNLRYRVCIQKVQNDCSRSFLEQVSSAPFVHSLLPLPKSYSTYGTVNLEWQHVRCLVSNFRFIQVLCLCINVYVEYFNEGITELVLLKFLRISIRSYCTIPALPSIKKLQNLETLILIEMGKVPVPLMDILQMEKLRHLCVRGVPTPTGFYDYCIPPLETLRTFSYANLVLPYKKLELFFGVIPNVENLKFQFENPKSPKDSNPILNLDCLSRLESLTVREVNTGFMCPNFELYFPSTLKKLHLLNFRLAFVEKLPKLEVLKLDGGSFEKTWNVEDEEFPNLRFLKLRSLKIDELNASDNSFRHLEQFIVEMCEFLQEIPFRFANIPTLKLIQVDSNHLESSARQIQEEQQELGNELLQVEKFKVDRSYGTWPTSPLT